MPPSGSQCSGRTAGSRRWRRARRRRPAVVRRRRPPSLLRTAAGARWSCGAPQAVQITVAGPCRSSPGSGRPPRCQAVDVTNGPLRPAASARWPLCRRGRPCGRVARPSSGAAAGGPRGGGHRAGRGKRLSGTAELVESPGAGVVHGSPPPASMGVFMGVGYACRSPVVQRVTHLSRRPHLLHIVRPACRDAVFGLDRLGRPCLAFGGWNMADGAAATRLHLLSTSAAPTCPCGGWLTGPPKRRGAVARTRQAADAAGAAAHDVEFVLRVRGGEELAALPAHPRHRGPGRDGGWFAPERCPTDAPDATARCHVTRLAPSGAGASRRRCYFSLPSSPAEAWRADTG